MGLTSSVTLAVVALLCIAVPVCSLLVWNRLGRNPVVRVAGRSTLLVSGQLLAVLLAGLLLNNSYGFYTSWAELFGSSSVSTTSGPVVTHGLDKRYALTLRAAFHSGHGTVIRWAIPGSASGIAPQPALIYLPAAYGNPAAAGTMFPVVELLHGFPSSPQTWTGPLRLQSILDAQISQGQSAPFIAVMPTQNVMFPRDTQCVNVVGGPRVDTYLTIDVRNAVLHNFRAASQPTSWAMMGYSTGGYCALNLAMRHPALYSAAVSLSGYSEPDHDRSTGILFGGSAALRNDNSPLWQAAHWSRGALSVLVVASHDDGASYRDMLKLAAVARGSLRVWAVLMRHGGHNAALWRRIEPAAFNWLSRQLSGPLAPIDIHGGVMRSPGQAPIPSLRHPRILPAACPAHPVLGAHKHCRHRP